MGCKKNLKFQVKPKDLFMYKSKMETIEEAFPYLTADDQAIILSEICKECMDSILVYKSKG